MNNLKFYQNRGVSIYLTSTQSCADIFHLTGKILFENNVAINMVQEYIQKEVPLYLIKILIYNLTIIL